MIAADEKLLQAMSGRFPMCQDGRNDLYKHSRLRDWYHRTTEVKYLAWLAFGMNLRGMKDLVPNDTENKTWIISASGGHKPSKERADQIRALLPPFRKIRAAFKKKYQTAQ